MARWRDGAMARVEDGEGTAVLYSNSTLRSTITITITTVRPRRYYYYSTTTTVLLLQYYYDSTITTVLLRQMYGHCLFLCVDSASNLGAMAIDDVEAI